MSSSSEIVFDTGSFRDRSGRVFYRGNEVLRALGEDAWRDWQALARTRFSRTFQQNGRLIESEALDLHACELPADGGAWAGVLRHERVPVVSYPYEWSFAMLQDAALLQLDLLLAALDEGMVLKDGSAFNVQWRGAKPVFIDVSSLTRLTGDRLWDGYLQFCQTMLYPLLLQAYKDVDFQPWLRGRIEGIAPSEMSNLMSLRDLLRPGVFTHVFLQSRLQARYAERAPALSGGGDSARRAALIRANARRLRKLIGSLRWRRQSSPWSEYAERVPYRPDDFEKKRTFVTKAVSTQRWRLVWDLGCNDGTFSRLAAQHADYVLALDSDHLAVDRLYRELRATESHNILPLCVNFADPSPTLGWRGRERGDILSRGRPSLVLCLALIHHLVIGANIVLEDRLDLLAGLGASLVIELVTRDDPMVAHLLRHREDVFSDYDQARFERGLARRFKILDRMVLSTGTRVLTFAAPLNAPDEAPSVTQVGDRRPNQVPGHARVRPKLNDSAGRGP